MENLEKTFQLQDIPPSQFQWKDQTIAAQQWCSEFRIPYIKQK